ncbi:MAG: family 43 glycosylhydrolase [Phycisphaerae bacterium]|nr:family 43 glycosylhydrolase [Phycisphaerae bacterium]
MSPFDVEKLRTPHKIAHLVLSPSFQMDTFESHRIDCPNPFHYRDSYYMTYVGWDSIGYRTGLASSQDLLTWKKEGLILDRGPRGSLTEFNAAMTNIIRDNDLFGPGELRIIDGRFIGTYHAYPGAGYESGPAIIGLCFSHDLRHWELTGPVLQAKDGADWERGGLYKSWIVEHDGIYYLFYNAKNQSEGSWNEQIGLATSKDLTTWNRYEGNPILRNGPAGTFDDRFASDPCVFRYGNGWVMFYFGLSSDGHARNSVAFSDDLLHWTKSETILIDIGGPGSIDSIYAHKPGMIARDGKLYHFYCAVSPNPNPDQKMGQIRTGEIRGIALAHQ